MTSWLFLDTVNTLMVYHVKSKSIFQKASIARITVYQEKNDYLKYIDDLLEPFNKSSEKPKSDIIDCHIVWYDKGTGGIMDKVIRYVESVTFEKRIDGHAVINYKEHPR